MPSYIELDKQSSFPNSSNTGKVIFGINSSGEVVLTNSDGTTNNFGSGSSSSTNLSINTFTMGDKVSFTKTDYGSEVDIIISGELEITRRTSSGIYNSAYEVEFDAERSPSRTIWNSYFTDSLSYGWGNIGNVENRGYDTWMIAVDNNFDRNVLNYDYIMYFNNGHGTTAYYLIRFTQWTPGTAGGGFSYDRYELFPTTNFVRDNYSADTVDVVTSGSTVLKRDNNGGGLYNEILESYYNQDSYQSPLGTRWNSIYTDSVRYGFNDFNNVRTRTYGSFREACNNQVGNLVTSTDLIMHDLASDNYYKMIFSNWQSSGNGGGVTYDRILIPENQVITFSDGTVKRTAGEPTYVGLDATNDLYIPEPGIYYFNTLSLNYGTLYFPNPKNLNGQKITLVFGFLGEGGGMVLRGDFIPVDMLGNRAQDPGSGMYEYTSLNGLWVNTIIY